MAQRKSGYIRAASDKYYTPDWVVEELLRREQFRDEILDPAAGAGHMVEVFIGAGYRGTGFDIEMDPAPIVPAMPVQDFLTYETDEDAIVTNPPYGGLGSLAKKFIKHALDLTEDRKGKVAMLLRVDFDSAKSRRVVFAEHPAFAAKYVFNRRIHWANLPKVYNENGNLVQSSDNHAWFVWDWAKTTPAGEGIRYGYVA